MKIRIIKGNLKLPASTYILNMGPATGCPSRRLGLCQAGAACYALKAEKLYPACLPARRRDARAWKATPAAEIARQILETSERARSPMQAFRFSEAGDFYGQPDVEKMAEVCRIISAAGVECYGYTARTDLDLSPLLKVARVNVSNDSNAWTEKGANRFKMVRELAPRTLTCAGDCRRCALCFTIRGKTVQILKH